MLGRSLPMATIALGREAAIILASGTPIVCIAAQQPYSQGVTVAEPTVMAMQSRLTPAWVALPGLAASASNLAEGFRTIWRRPALPVVLIRQNLLQRPGQQRAAPKVCRAKAWVDQTSGRFPR